MKNLKTLRRKLGYSGEKLGELVGVKKSAISKYELDKAQPSQDILIKLSQVLNCSIDFLLDKTDDPTPFCEIKSNETLGTIIRKARGDLSLRDFAKKCEISHTHLDSIEKGYDPRTGKRVSITLDTLSKLSKATGYSISYLISEYENKTIEINKISTVKQDLELSEEEKDIIRILHKIPVLKERWKAIGKFEEIVERMTAESSNELSLSRELATAEKEPKKYTKRDNVIYPNFSKK